MTINDAFNFFTKLQSERPTKLEQKVYKDFIQILLGLKQRDLSAADIQNIETELESLHLDSNPANRKRFYRKANRTFKKYLLEKHSLLTKGHYTTIGTGLGMTFGTTFAVVFLSNSDQSMGMALGISLGMIIGFGIGQYMDKQAKADGRVI